MESYFPTHRVKTLSEEDFGEGITLKDNLTCVVLFYDDSVLSREIELLWDRVCSKTISFDFYKCFY